MRVHVDVLGWLHVMWGAFGILAGLSLEVLASGTSVARDELVATRDSAAVWLFIVSGLGLVAAGAAMMLVGRSLVRRHRRGRYAALIAAIANLAVVPFGTALGIYSFWTLLNDEARREFSGAPSSSAIG
jgi:hypothetical protein